MKRTFLAIILLSVSVSLFAGAYLSYFHVQSDEENIVLSWQTSQEIDLKEFKILRKSVNGSFIEIGTVLPKGNNSVYTYTDENAFKTQDALYIYKLNIVDNSGLVTESQEVSVSHSPTTVKRTWGSIKALFR